MSEIKLERRRAPIVSLSLDQTLRASDEILELLPIATCICDLEGRIVHYNRRALEVWGRPPQTGDTHEQFSAKTKFFSLDGVRQPGSKINEVLRTGRVVRDEELLVERPDGRRLVMMFNVDPLFDEQDKLVGVVNCMQDVTERKQVLEALARSQQDLRQQEQRWNATYEHAAIGIVEIDADGRFLRVNEAICAITGLSREELLGWRLFNRTHPDDRDMDEDLYRRQVKNEIGFYSLEKRFIRKNGRVIWISVRSSTVRDADGNFLYGVRVVQDITERKEAEERQKLLIDELNHRVKNTLATVQSLATQTARGTSSPEEFRKAFEGRLIALSQAHDQLTRRHWRSADLRDIVTGATAPYVGTADRFVILGDDVMVTPRAALTLALAFHELTTNAVKYGALSVPSGRVEAHWRVLRSSQPPRLRFEWQEHGGPVVRMPERRGFGSRFIEGSVESELQGSARLQFDPAGLACTIDIPLDPDLMKARADRE
jgi:PAS domain S-box-containing protein